MVFLDNLREIFFRAGEFEIEIDEVKVI